MRRKKDKRKQEREGILAARYADGDAVPLLDHLIIVYGPSDIGQEMLYFFHARPFPPPHILY